jgi:hypothetical protein
MCRWLRSSIEAMASKVRQRRLHWFEYTIMFWVLLRNCLHTFLRLVEVVRSIDQQAVNALIEQRDYEELDWLILNSLMGRSPS